MSAVKPLYWVGSSKKDIALMPEEVQDIFGYALYLAQIGRKHEDAKPLKGFGSAGVLEVVGTGTGTRIAPSIRFALPQPCLCCMCFRRKPGRGSKPRSMRSI